MAPPCSESSLFVHIVQDGHDISHGCQRLRIRCERPAINLRVGGIESRATFVVEQGIHLRDIINSLPQFCQPRRLFRRRSVGAGLHKERLAWIAIYQLMQFRLGVSPFCPGIVDKTLENGIDG